VTPKRGRRRELRFSFQDLIVLRTARALIAAEVPRRRITRSLEELRRNLPDTVPLSGLSICAVGDRVVVRDGIAHWQADDGQYLLGLDVGAQDGVLRVIERAPEQTPLEAVPETADTFSQALAVEDNDPRAAIKLYQQTTATDRCNIAAWINWGRLHHELGELQEAEGVYRRASLECGPDALLMFNLGVVLEDTGQVEPALEAYRAAIEQDPALADCHYNLARLYESIDRPQHAIRHFGQYRRLVRNENR
jgi:tetratricopeptide (TPR) repeat protein